MTDTARDANRFFAALLRGELLAPAQLAETRHTVPVLNDHAGPPPPPADGRPSPYFSWKTLAWSAAGDSSTVPSYGVTYSQPPAPIPFPSLSGVAARTGATLGAGTGTAARPNARNDPFHRFRGSGVRLLLYRQRAAGTVRGPEDMRRNAKSLRPRRAVALPFALLIGVTGLAGCGGEDSPAPEASVHVEETGGGGDEYDFVYGDLADAEFWNDVSTWVGKRVTIRADVDEVIDEHAFSIAAAEDDAGTDRRVRSLLVVSREARQVEEGGTVRVTGTVREGFVPEDVAEGLAVDWEEDLFGDWEREQYVVATSVDTSVDGA
ncbi:hypothetical protein [Streptomyces radiopugnans]|uniref:Uncharacterized protein n=1 Tax=Streptomyces radiopugnans TaxID=403935 RepID=A0A1H9C5U3_9ACTN|nr:hypothetical protein SAMN05216481_10355 [Streptomyces radiopugnans]